MKKKILQIGNLLAAAVLVCALCGCTGGDFFGWRELPLEAEREMAQIAAIRRRYRGGEYDFAEASSELERICGYYESLAKEAERKLLEFRKQHPEEYREQLKRELQEAIRLEDYDRAMELLALLREFEA